MMISELVLELMEILVDKGDLEIEGVVRTWSHNQMHSQDSYPTENVSIEFEPVSSKLRFRLEVQR